MNRLIEKTTLTFLKNLSKNNDPAAAGGGREWFNKNKAHYLVAHENMIAFADALLVAIRKHDAIETVSGKDALMRIYRDTRFSKDKTPYKTYFGGGFRRATKKLRGGYYFQIGPGNSLAAGGFFGPSPDDLKRIRQEIDINVVDWNKTISNKTILKTFGQLKGEKLSTAPRGFAKDSPGIEYVKHKQFYFERKFDDTEVLSAGFLKELNQTFKNLRPYFDYMSEVLTTDLNGVSIA
jgi:uncharacterized protein (TIGR02453 family)